MIIKKQRTWFCLKFDFTSKMFLLLAMIIGMPIIMVVPFPDDRDFALSFTVPSMVTALIGIFMSKRDRLFHDKKIFGKQQETVTVVGIWIYAFFIGSMPFLLSGQLNFVRALFESVSGWTTTGLSVVDVEKTPPIYLFYRSLMQYCGGLGFVMLMLLFASGKNAMKLFSAEGHADRLEPNLRSTAKTMIFIYIGFTASGATAYGILGMNWFDALNHAMAALSTGGFSTRSDSIGSFQSLPIEMVTIVLMLLGTTNFAILALLLKGKFRTILKIGELRFFSFLLVLSIPILTMSGLYGIYQNMADSLRAAIFQSVSALSTTGFSTVDISIWHADMILLLILLMIIGGGAGSTAGGLKYSRVYVLLKTLIADIKMRFLPERIVSESYTYKPQGKIYLTPKYVSDVSRFAFAYIVILLIGTLLTAFSGIPTETALFEFTSALGTVGLSTGATGPTTQPFMLIVEMAGMILGRLEIFIVIVALVSLFSKPHKRIDEM
ncbi:MAG: potassium transporter TrkG [Bacillota bacterium]|nr:potassium transporter TrkG [Bacillota bacterium]